MDEIIEMLEERHTPLEIVEILYSLDKFDVDNYAVEHDICPLCLGELVIHRYKDYRGDFWGFPAYEEMCELMCSRCGEVF